MDADEAPDGAALARVFCRDETADSAESSQCSVIFVRVFVK